MKENSTVANFATVQKEGKRTVERDVEYYKLDVISLLQDLLEYANEVKVWWMMVLRCRD
ncbi:virulence RhuM family protein [Sphingobacterium paucimobilis]|uniref:virulence RhuM family protein n=1 Tax=Sphingobacterium paucimobilis TaxID=1385985 RepID=UPI0011846099|nr:virulence RhuM family protein [Sphingobacterium paucimobilis]